MAAPAGGEHPPGAGRACGGLERAAHYWRCCYALAIMATVMRRPLLTAVTVPAVTVPAGAFVRFDRTVVVRVIMDDPNRCPTAPFLAYDG